MGRVCAGSVPRGEPHQRQPMLYTFLFFLSYAKPRDISFPGQYVQARQTVKSVKIIAYSPCKHALGLTQWLRGSAPRGAPTCPPHQSNPAWRPGAEGLQGTEHRYMKVCPSTACPVSPPLQFQMAAAKGLFPRS